MRVKAISFVLSAALCFVTSFECPSLKITASTPSCSPELFTYRVLNNTEIVSESGVLTAGTNHSIPFCTPGSYSILIANHGANESCSPTWSLSDTKNTVFFSSYEGFIQGSQAFFTVDKSGCFKLSQYSSDFAVHNATAANSTCFKQCPRIRINAVPKCRTAHFKYQVSSGADVIDSGRVRDLADKLVPVCAGTYSVFLYNNAAHPECSPDNWTIVTDAGFTVYSSPGMFSLESEASFLVDSNMCVNLTQFISDSDAFNATEKNSSCYGSGIAPITVSPPVTISPITITPPITVIPTVSPITVIPTVSPITAIPPVTAIPVHTETIKPTMNVSQVLIPEQTDSSANHFWLHTFWGIFLIVVFCIIAVLALAWIAYSCTNKPKQQEVSGERQPLVGAA